MKKGILAVIVGIAVVGVIAFVSYNSTAKTPAGSHASQVMFAKNIQFDNVKFVPLTNFDDNIMFVGQNVQVFTFGNISYFWGFVNVGDNIFPMLNVFPTFPTKYADNVKKFSSNVNIFKNGLGWAAFNKNFRIVNFDNGMNKVFDVWNVNIDQLRNIRFASVANFATNVNFKTIYFHFFNF